MKHIKSIIIVAICILLLQTSCESFLEETPIDEITVDYIYSSVDGLEVGVNALYNRQRRNNVPGRCDRNIGLANLMLYLGTDLGHLRGWFNPYESNFHTAARYPDGKWVLSYEIIDRVNAIINSSKDLEQSDRLKTAVAEAKVIRAENYLDLIRMYGIILLDTTHTTPENYQDEVVYEPANQADVYKLIDSDLDYAIANLKYDVESGRYGKGVARHLKGKSAMWQSKWSEAVKQFDAIIEDGPYRLVDLKDVFGQNLNHEEAIYVYPRDDAYGDDDNLAGGDDIWMCGIFNNRYYEMSTGELIKSAELGGQSMGWMYPNDYLQSLYDKDNDKRYTTYYYPTKLYVNNPDHPNFGQEISTYDDNFRYKSIVPRMPNELIAVVNGSTVSFIDSVNHRLWFHHTLPPFHVYDIDMADGQFIMATSQGLYILDFQKDAGFYFADNKLYRTIGDMIDHKAFNENWAIVGDFILPGTGIEDISVRGCATQYINNKKYLTFSYKNRGVVVAQMDFKSNLFTLLGNFLAGNPKVFSPVSQFEAGHVWLATNGDLYFVNKSDSISTGLWAVYDIRTATGISYYYDDARIKYVKTLKGRSGAGFKNNNVLILGVQNNIMILDTDEYNSNIVLLDNTILPEVSSVFGISYDFKGYLISEDTVIYNGQLVTGVTGLSELSLNNSLIISQSVINGTISDICEGGSVYVATDVGVTSDQESNILEGLTFESVTPLTPYVTEVVFNRDISDVSDIIDLTDKDNYEFGIPIFEIKQISERVVNIVTRHSQIEDREYRLRLWVAA